MREAPVYLFDLVEDRPEIGGVAAVSRRLREALAARLGPRLVPVRGLAASLGCGDPGEDYLARERRAILRLAERDPHSTFLIPNFQSPVGRRAGRPRPRIINVVHDAQFAHLTDLFTEDQRAWLGSAYAETRANADAVAFVSRATRDDFHRLFGAPRREAIIPAPIGGALADAAADPIAGGAPYLLAVQHGGHHPHKNVDGLLRLFAGLADRFPDLDLLVAGRGAAGFLRARDRLPEPLRRRARHVGFLPRADLAALYRGARAFVSLSRFEGFNMPAAEAACHGAPLILSDLSVHREFHAEAACLLDPAAPDLDAAARYLAEDAERLRGSAWAGAASCSAEAVAAAHARLIDDIEAEAPSWRLSPTTRVFRVGTGRLRTRPVLDPARAAVRRRRFAQLLLAGTVLGGAAACGPGIDPAAASQGPTTSCFFVNAPGGAGGTSSDGGAGGSGGVAGNAAGSGSSGSSGYYGGGGGGAGGDCITPTGGGGGNSDNNRGGAGSATGGMNPAAGGTGSLGGFDGGSGGGGGYYGGTLTAASGPGFTGGNGGTGGYYSGGGLDGAAAGGGGGGGGLGTGVTGSGTLTGSSFGGNGGGGGSVREYGMAGNGGDGGIGAAVFNNGSPIALEIGSGVAVTGGAGGAGGNATTDGTNSGIVGTGGAGGVGLLVVTAAPNNAITAITVDSGASVMGGNGGATGTGGGGSAANAAEVTPGGVGILGSNLAIATSGSIAGGKSSDGSYANAITFTGGTNTLDLNPNASFTGDIAVTGSLTFFTPTAGVDTTITNAPGSGTTAITDGPDGAGSVVKAGPGRLILSGSNSYSNGTTIQGGTLQFGTAASLGGGIVTLDGGTLQSPAQGGSTFGLTLPNPIRVGASGGTVDLDGNFFTLAGGLSDGSAMPGRLTYTNSRYNAQVGGGVIVTLSGASGFSGGSVITGGAYVQSGIDDALGTGSLQVGSGGAFFLGDHAQGVTRLTGTGIISAFGSSAGPATSLLSVQSGSFGGAIEDGRRAVDILALTKLSDGSASGGTLVLSGQSFYTGDTTVAAGTLQAGSTTGLADYSAFRVAAGATLDLGGYSNGVRALTGRGLVTNAGAGAAALTVGAIDDTSSQFDGTLADGAAPLALGKAGAGTLTLTGTNTYTGGTTVTAGTLQVGAGGTAGSIAGDVVDDAALAFARSDTLAYGGAISGTGTLTQAGAGTLRLTGASSYTGATTVADGRLAVDGALGNTAVAVASGATLGGSGTIAGPVTIADGGVLAPGLGQGPAILSVGSLTLTPGTNGSTGSVLNYGLGTVAAGSGPTSDRTDVAGNLVLAGTLNAADAGGFTYGSYRIFNYGGALTNDGLAVGSLPAGYTGVVQTVIPNQINLVVASPTTPVQFWDGPLLAGNGTIAGGSGTWNNQLTNWTDPNGANNAAWGRGVGIFAGAPGTATVADAIAFQGLQFITDGTTVAAAAGGTLLPTGQAFVRVGTGATATISAPITGAGGLVKLSNGTLVLAADETFTGGTTVGEGTLQLGNGGAAGSVAGNIADNSALVFDHGAPVSYGGVISGTGSLSQAGAGALTLTGASTYTGQTTIAAGTTLALAGGGSIAASSGVADDGTLDLSASGGASLASLSGGGAVALGAQRLTLLNAFGTFSGAIGGTGSLAIQAGTETLTGADAYTGGTTIAPGATLQVGAGGAAGSITGDVVDLGTLAFDRSDDVTFAGRITGSGALAKAGSGALTLSGGNGYAGGTSLQQGTLAVASDTALGTGALRFSNGTTLQAAADGLILANPASVAGTGTVDTQGYRFGLAGPVSGPGALAKTGSGTLALTGDNSYSGGTRLLQGTLAIGSGAALGIGRLSMDDGTELRFTAPDMVLGNAVRLTGAADPTIDTGAYTATLSGDVSGPGALTKQGGGTLVLLGTDSATGATRVAAGTLEVDGAAEATAVTVGDGATLSGTGSVGSIAARGGSAVSPGSAANPYGTLRTPGSVAFAQAATFRVAVGAGGQNSALAVGGTATLGGAAVTVSSAPGTYDASTRYTILTAAGGVQGVFGTLSTAQALAFLSPYLTYGADAVTLNFRSNGTSFADVAATPNERAAAGALQSLDPAGALVRSLQGLSPDAARRALDALAGAVYAGVATVAAQDATRVSGQILDRLWNIGGGEIDARTLLQQLDAPRDLPAFVNCFAPQPAPSPRTPPTIVTAWGEGFGDFGHDGADRNGAGLDRNPGGFVVGYDAPLHGLGAPVRIGVAGGYTDDAFSGTGTGGGNGTFESVFGSLYGGARFGAVELRGGAAAAGTSSTVNRTVSYPGFLDGERSVYGGNTEQVFGEVGYRFSGTRWVVEPVAGGAYLHVHQDGFRERGGAAALTGVAQDDDVGTTTLGARGEAAPFVGVPLVARAFLGWRHAFGDLDPSTRLSFQAGSIPFASQGAALDRDALAAEAGIDWRFSGALTLGIAYIGQIGGRDDDNGVKGRLEYKF